MGKPEGSLTDSTVGQAYMVQVMYAAVCPLVLKKAMLGLTNGEDACW